jgi:hypothetical protein
VLVAHACNPSYSAGRDEKDHSSKTVWTNRLTAPISKNPSHTHKKGLVEWLKVKALISSPGTSKNKKVGGWFLYFEDMLNLCLFYQH